MNHLTFLLLLCSLAVAQTPSIVIRPNAGAPDGGIANGSRTARIAFPILGYVVDGDSSNLTVIAGAARAPHLVSGVPLPSDTRRLFVPPGERYFLIERTASDALAIWLPDRDTENGPSGGAALSGVKPHPDVLAFSARGEAAVAYTKGSGTLQIISRLPAGPIVISQPSIANFGQVSFFAVSDDGAVMVARLLDGRAIVSAKAGAWQRFVAADGTRAMMFVPKTHDLVVSDSALHLLSLVPEAGENFGAFILSREIDADSLAFTADGDELLAASSIRSELKVLQMDTSALVGSFATNFETLLPLRDGRTFLLSSQPSNSSLFNLLIGGDAARFLPMTR